MKRLHHSLLASALVLCTLPASAQVVSSPEARDDAQVQVTPFVSFGSTASSRVGAAIRFALTPRLGLEAETGYRRGEIGALSAHVSLLYDLPRVGNLTPYLATGIGIEEFATAADVPGLGLVTQERLALAVNAGAGVNAKVNQRWGVRTDARWFNGLGTNAPEHWRLYNGLTFRPTAR